MSTSIRPGSYPIMQRCVRYNLYICDRSSYNSRIRIWRHYSHQSRCCRIWRQPCTRPSSITSMRYGVLTLIPPWPRWWPSSRWIIRTRRSGSWGTPSSTSFYPRPPKPNPATPSKLISSSWMGVTNSPYSVSIQHSSNRSELTVWSNLIVYPQPPCWFELCWHPWAMMDWSPSPWRTTHRRIGSWRRSSKRCLRMVLDSTTPTCAPFGTRRRICISTACSAPTNLKQNWWLGWCPTRTWPNRWPLLRRFHGWTRSWSGMPTPTYSSWCTSPSISPKWGSRSPSTVFITFPIRATRLWPSTPSTRPVGCTSTKATTTKMSSHAPPTIGTPHCRVHNSMKGTSSSRMCHSKKTPISSSRSGRSSTHKEVPRLGSTRSGGRLFRYSHRMGIFYVILYQRFIKSGNY